MYYHTSDTRNGITSEPCSPRIGGPLSTYMHIPCLTAAAVGGRKRDFNLNVNSLSHLLLLSCRGFFVIPYRPSSQRSIRYRGGRHDLCRLPFQLTIAFGSLAGGDLKGNQSTHGHSAKMPGRNYYCRAETAPKRDPRTNWGRAVKHIVGKVYWHWE